MSENRGQNTEDRNPMVEQKDETPYLSSIL
jgi:hypothetical protein